MAGSISHSEPLVDIDVLLNKAQSLFMQPSDDSKRLLLSDVVAGFQYILNGQNEAEKGRVCETLGNAARDEYWRPFIGETGLLKTVLDHLKPASVMEAQNTMIQVMRVLANSCADTDENRDIVIKGGGVNEILLIIQTQTDLVSVALVVLYNLCMDNALAQKASIEAQAAARILEVMSRNPDQSVDISYCIKILELFFLGDHGEDALKTFDPTSFSTLFLIFETLDLDFDDYTSLFRVLEFLLEPAGNQQSVLDDKLLEAIHTLLADSYARFSDVEEPLSEDDEKAFIKLRAILVEMLGNLSSLDTFTDIYPLSSDFVINLKSDLSSDHIELQTAAAITYGNLARSDVACATLLNDHNIHVPLVNLLAGKTQVGVLHAAAGVLKNLAISGIQAKEAIGSLGAIELCDKFYETSGMGQVQYIGVGLVRVLISNCPSNIGRLLTPTSNESGKTHLSLLLELNPKTDELPVKTEISRIVVAALRCIYSPSTAEDVISRDELASRLWSSGDSLARPVLDMVLQNKWPVVRSEGWFALALLARNTQGCGMVCGALPQLQGFWDVLYETLGRKDELEAARGGKKKKDADEGEDELKSSADALKKDKDNATIFMTEMVKNSTAENDHGTVEFDPTVFRDVLCQKPVGEYVHKLPKQEAGQAEEETGRADLIQAEQERIVEVE